MTTKENKLHTEENIQLTLCSDNSMSNTGEDNVLINDQQNAENLDNSTGIHSKFGINNHVNSEKKSGFKLLLSLSGRQGCILFLIALAQVLVNVASSMLGPFYPLEAEKKGMKMGTVGIVIGLFYAVIFFTAPFVGNYMVKVGSKFSFTAGIFLGGCCCILFGALEYCPRGTPFIVMSLLIRVVQALGFSVFLTASFAIVSSEFKENVGFCVGILVSATGLGFLIGPMAGGLLYELGGFGLPFYFAGIAIMLNLIAVYKFLPAADGHTSNRKGSMLTLLKSPVVVVSLCSVFVGMTGITVFDTTFGKHLDQLGLSVGRIGLMYGCLDIVHSIMSAVWGYLTDSKDILAPLIIVGQLVFGTGFLIMGPSNLLPFLQLDLVTIVVGMTLVGVSYGCCLVPTMKCVVIGATEMGFEPSMDTFAMVSGLFNSFHYLGGFVGPVGIGYLIEGFGFPVAYTVVGMSAVFMMVVSLIFFVNRNLRNRGYAELRGHRERQF